MSYIGIILIVYIILNAGVRYAQVKQAATKTAVHTIVVLGHRLNHNEPEPLLLDRLKKGAKLWQEHQNAVIIVTGGMTGHSSVSEAHIMQQHLCKHHNLDETIVIQEHRALSTLENLLYSKPLLRRGAILVVSSDFHVFRTVLILKLLKIQATVVSTKTTGKLRVKQEIREQLALIKLALMTIIRFKEIKEVRKWSL